MIIDYDIWVQSRMARKSNCLCPKIRVPSNYPFWFFVYRNPSAACLQQMQCICRQSVHMLRWFCQRSRLSRRPEAAPISGKISRFRQNPEAPIFGKISRFRQNPEAPIFRKICHFRKFLNRQISGKIRGFVRNFRKIWDFWHNCTMYWINSGYNCRVSDRGAHFFGRRPVLCIRAKPLSRRRLKLPKTGFIMISGNFQWKNGAKRHLTSCHPFFLVFHDIRHPV